VLQHYLNFVKPAYEEFCMPTKKFADVIIPRGADNKIGIELIRQGVQNKNSFLKTAPNFAGFSLRGITFFVSYRYVLNESCVQIQV
jgi:hypothetical protein